MLDAFFELLSPKERIFTYKDYGYGCQQKATYFSALNSVSFIAVGGNLSVMAFKEVAHFAPLCPIILTAALLASRETSRLMNLATVHLWGQGKPLFTIAPMIQRFSFQLLFDKYINYDLGMTVQSDCHEPSCASPCLPLVLSFLRFLELSSKGLRLVISTGPILGIISCVS